MTDRPTIGPYRIVSRVGAGGMGEVFKAWDPRLERDVAIKLLHREAASDPDRQRRLLAEGRAASALNHPNILRVYDADVDGDAYYLVSEWLEGKSLRDELARGPLPLKRLLELAVQIADGLAAAHAMGVVHRDIKPENVMLARDGTARIVDFGLARAEHRATSTAETIAHSATVSLEGGISGTPAYMSPEQARGTLGDFRTDQFSFGALLYELATGAHAFRRDSIPATLAAVLHEEPRPIAERNPRAPAPLRWIIEQCLAKDPADRYGATEDLARELRRVRDRLVEVVAPAQVEPASAATWPLRIAAPFAGAVAIGAVMMFGLAPEAPSITPGRVTPFASASVYESEPAWSPDGQSIAYTADVSGVLQVFAKRVGDAVSRQITSGRFDASHPFWSRDGQRIFYISLAGAEDSLWSIGVAGGRPQLEIQNVLFAALAPDGSRIALLRGETDQVRQTLWWSEPPGAEPRRESRAPFDTLRNGGDTQVRFSDNGQLLIWMYDIDVDSGGANPSAYYVLTPGTDPPRRVLEQLDSRTNLTPFAWLPDNRHVILAQMEPTGSNRHLWLADTASTALRQITAGHTSETAPSVAPGGTRIAYASEEVDFDLARIDADGRGREVALATARNEFDPAWSPLGDQYAFVTDRSGEIQIWARSRDGLWERPIVTPSDFGESRTETLGSLAFSPDGKTLAYQRSSGGTWDIWLSPATGGSPVKLIPEASGPQRPWRDAPTWSPDGEWIAFVDNTSGATSVRKARVGGSERASLLNDVIIFSRPVWSPDGRWIAAQTAEGLLRVPAAGGNAEPITDMPIIAVAWRPDSRRLAALTDSETPGHFAMADIDAFSGETRTLNPDLGPVPIANQAIRGFSSSPKEGFLTSFASARSDIWLLDGVTAPASWWETLRRRFVQ
jgi:Tol biopolymer transport system component